MSILFQNLSLRKLTLPNRVIVSPMCQYSAVEGDAQDWHDVHLGQLALGSAGMLMLEATAVEDIGRITPACLGLYSDTNEERLTALVARLRNLNPHASLPLCLQLAHAGRKASSHAPWNTGQQIPLEEGGWTAVAPSAVPQREGELPPRALSLAELATLQETFVTACHRADAAGFDAIELHCAHGYLLHQFLSPVANRRTDAYGGSLENRMRFPLQVFAAARRAWPEDKPMGVRVSATDWDSESSWNLEECIVFCQALAEAGCDWIDVSSGGVSVNQKIELKPGYQVAFASEIRRQTGLPVMAVGLITAARQAEEILADGHADMVALARGFLYNPRWVWHAAAELGAVVSAPPQYWRSTPVSAGRLFGDVKVGQR
jgi:NADPH2 dehydrogenase